MAEMVPMPACFALVVDIAVQLGVSHINQLPGLWEHDVDGHWRIKINGHHEEVDKIPPYAMLVEFNGWPAGIVHPLHGGVIAAGAAANEDTFIKALQEHLEDLQARG